VVPAGLERLIHVRVGREEVDRFLQKLRRGGTYYIDDRFLHSLRQGMYVTVNSDHRILAAIAGIYTTHGYLAGPAAALTYAGLQDYRARTGENRTALVMTEKSPRLNKAAVAEALGTTEERLAEFF